MAEPYKPVTVALPQPMTDESFDAMRKQLGEAAQRKDRAAMARLVVAQGFFWQRENRIVADPHKSGLDVLSAALGLNNKDGAGWDILTAYRRSDRLAGARPHRRPVRAGRSGVRPQGIRRVDQGDEYRSDEWGYPVSTEIEVHAARSRGTGDRKLSLYFVHIMPETASIRRRTACRDTEWPDRLCLVDFIAPIGNDQICYVKDNGAWKIGGYVGGGEPQ